MITKRLQSFVSQLLLLGGKFRFIVLANAYCISEHFPYCNDHGGRGAPRLFAIISELRDDKSTRQCVYYILKTIQPYSVFVSKSKDKKLED